MKRRTVMGLGLTLAIGTAAPAAAQDFEGTVKFRTLTVESDGLYEALGDAAYDDDGITAKEVLDIPMERVEQLAEIQDMTYWIKGRKLRIDGPEYFAVMDMDERVMRTFQPSQKIYMEISLAQLEQMGQGMDDLADAEAESSEAEVRSLGDTRTINGMKATGYEVRAGGELSRGWVTEEHGALIESIRRIMELAAVGEEEDDDDALSLLAEYGLPILVQTYDGYETYDIEEILTVEAGTVSDDLFDIPAGYTKRTFPGM